MRSVPKSACHFLGQWPRRVRHAEEKEKKEEKAIRPCRVLKQETESHIRPVCVSSRESKTQIDIQPFWKVQSVWRNREKHSESVREWKRKRRHFSLLKLYTRKINWRNSHRVFECYNHGELEYSDEDFASGFGEIVFTLRDLFVVYPIYCGLKFSINLIVVISIS